MSDTTSERNSTTGPDEIPPIQPDFEKRSDQGWAHIVLDNLQRRNNSQVEPFSAIYQSNTKLWYEHARLQSLLKDVKHQFAIVQHETADLFSATCSDGSSTAVDKLKLKLSQIQIELRERGNLESNERKAKIDLSKKVRDQAKLIADQSEELKMAKGELSSAHETNTFLSEEIKLERNSGILVKDEIENIRKLYLNLEKENAQLIERILLEKGKTAQAMNDMMNGVKDLQDTGSENDRTVCSAGGSSVSKERSRSTEFQSYPKIEKKPLEMKSISSLQCHNSEINDVYASSNGHYFATAGSDGVIKTFEMSTTRHQLNLKGSSPIICLDVSNSQGEANQWIVGGGSDGTCRVWNLHTGAMKFQISGHASKVHSCKFVGNGLNKLLTCSADRSIKMWDMTRTQAEVHCWMKGQSSVMSVTASPDQNTVVSGHQDGGVRLWDPARTSHCTHTVEKLHNAHVTHLQYSPRNSYEILTLSRDNTLSILDTRNYLCSQRFKSSAFRVTYDWSRASYSPDGRYVAAGSGDGGVYVWSTVDPDMCTMLTSSPKAGPISSITWSSPQGEIVAADKQGRCTIWK